MAVLVGIDEAGYGPLLGPLVISSSTFMLPDELIGKSWWKVLSASVSDKKSQLKGRLLITDSKKAYNRKGGMGHLERTSLACLICLGSHPKPIHDLLLILTPETLARLSKYQWYQRLDRHQLIGFNADAELAANVFSRDMKANGMTLLDVRSDCLDVGHYNSLIDKTKNKATVSFSSVCGHIQRAFKQYGKENLQIVVDRQGGRVNYVPSLSKMFPEMAISIIQENKDHCSYQLSDGGRSMKLHFVVKADSRSLPVSLASIVSKYVRELLMERINEYFISHIPDLEPTAGYWEDGLRFLEDIETKLPSLSIERAMLVRNK